MPEIVPSQVSDSGKPARSLERLAEITKRFTDLVTEDEHLWHFTSTVFVNAKELQHR